MLFMIRFKKRVVAISSLLLLFPCFSLAAEALPYEYEDEDIYMRLVIRTADQLSAFYLGREFPQAAVTEIMNHCFITPLLKNKTYEALWVEPNSWQLSRNGQTIKRIKRDYWKQKWQKTGLPLSHQSTFGWTLMPETRDLRLDEGVGGSIVIPRQSEPFTLKAHFNTQLDKLGQPKVVTYRNVSCAN